MTEYFETTEQLLKAFSIEALTDYYDHVVLSDSKVGFSIKRKYPESIRYKPAIRKDGEPDNIVAIWVVYTPQSETKKRKVPITVKVANMSLYRTNHFDYDFSDETCPTKISIEKSLSTPKPIELTYSNEFFYDHSRNEFLNESEEIIEGVDILNKVFNDHCNTVHWFKGLKLRMKLLAQSKVSGILSLIIDMLTFILKKFFGRTLEVSDKISSTFHGYKKDDFKKLNEDSLNILGYKAAKPTIILFCFLVILGTIIRYKTQITGGYFGYIGKNNTLTLVHGLFVLWMLDIIVPNILFWVINFMIKLRTSILFMSFRGP